jgi:hypothetical protein
MSPFMKLLIMKLYNQAQGLKQYISFDTEPTEELPSIGSIGWNNQEETLDIKIRDDVTLSIGSELHDKCVNKTGATIPNGSAVGIYGTQGNRPAIQYVNYTTHDACMRTIGLLTHDGENNTNVIVTTHGDVHDLDTSAFDVGDIVYVGETDGSLTNVRPAEGFMRIQIGMVTVSHNTQGVIRVKVIRERYIFGDYQNGNYSLFKDNGMLESRGTGTVWKDIDFPIVIRTTGPNIPTLTEVQDGLTAPSWAVNDTNMCEGQEFIHEWKEASEVSWHLHLLTNGSDVDARYVKFQIDWFWTNVNGQASATITQSYEYEIPAATPDKTMKLIPIYLWEPVGGRIGGHVYARLTRITSTGTAPSNNPWCTMLQMHVECDTGGSELVSSKFA